MHFVEENIDHLFREFSGKMASVLLRIFGFEHASLIDDIIQETFLTALHQWKTKGVPDYAEAWLMRVAKNKTINELRRLGKTNDNNNTELIIDGTQVEELFLDNEIEDSQLRALFACCTPILSQKNQIILTLKTLSGFGNREIAKALYMSDDAVKKSIYRSRIQLREENNRLEVPTIQQAAKRYQVVLKVCYLMFNEGYKTTEKPQIIDEDLCLEAIRLTKLLIGIGIENHGGSYALLALMHFSMARFSERQNSIGEFVSIEDQNRGNWDSGLIERGYYYLRKSREGNTLTRYHLEATIAALHCGSPGFEETDWQGIVSCYEKLFEFDDSFMMRLSHAMAVSQLNGAEVGLELLKDLDKKQDNSSNYLMAAMAKLHRDLGKYELAKSYYEVAIDLCTNPNDLVFLKKQLLTVLKTPGGNSN